MSVHDEEQSPVRAMLPPPDVLVLARPRSLRWLTRVAHALWAAVALASVGSLGLLVVDPIDSRPLVAPLAAAGLGAFVLATVAQVLAGRRLDDLVAVDTARREEAAREAFLAEPHESLPVLQAVAEELAAEAAEAAAQAAVRAAALAANVAKLAAAEAAGASVDEDVAAAARHAVAAADVAAAAVSQLLPRSRRSAEDLVLPVAADLDDDVLDGLVADELLDDGLMDDELLDDGLAVEEWTVAGAEDPDLRDDGDEVTVLDDEPDAAFWEDLGFRPVDDTTSWDDTADDLPDTAADDVLSDDMLPDEVLSDDVLSDDVLSDDVAPDDVPTPVLVPSQSHAPAAESVDVPDLDPADLDPSDSDTPEPTPLAPGWPAVADEPRPLRRIGARIPQPTYSFWDDEPGVSAGRTPGQTSPGR